MHRQELERYIIDEGFLYDDLEFRVSGAGRKTVFIIFGGANCSAKVQNLRKKLVDDNIRVVVTKMEAFLALFSKLPHWIDDESESKV